MCIRIKPVVVVASPTTAATFCTAHTKAEGHVVLVSMVRGRRQQYLSVSASDPYRCYYAGRINVIQLQHLGVVVASAAALHQHFRQIIQTVSVAVFATFVGVPSDNSAAACYTFIKHAALCRNRVDLPQPPPPLPSNTVDVVSQLQRKYRRASVRNLFKRGGFAVGVGWVGLLEVGCGCDCVY